LSDLEGGRDPELLVDGWLVLLVLLASSFRLGRAVVVGVAVAAGGTAGLRSSDFALPPVFAGAALVPALLLAGG